MSSRYVPVAQRIRHLTTNQGIAGSNPAGDVFVVRLYMFFVKQQITFPISLVGQDSRLSPDRPGFKSRHGNFFLQKSSFFKKALKKHPWWDSNPQSPDS